MELRDRRARQRLADALIQVPPDAIPLVEYQAGGGHGVAQLAYHPWGALLLPLDERQPWRDIRRGEIATMTLDSGVGGIEIGPTPAAVAAGQPAVRLLGLGESAHLHHDRFLELRDGAARDASALVSAFLPDASFGVRQSAAGLAIDGRPTTPAELGEAWTPVETAVLGEPTFAASYAGLRARGGDAAPVWISLAPDAPGSATPKAWFFVGLPGNLVAMELVTEGAHATYCFRVVPRAEYSGKPAAAVADPMAGPMAAAVADVSRALVDSRYLREPMALPDDQLRAARYLRYRLALAAIPSLAAARARFVARLVHSDEASWGAALDDLIAWHTMARDDAAAWPGRAAQEAQVTAAGGDDPGSAAGSTAAPTADTTTSAPIDPTTAAPIDPTT